MKQSEPYPPEVQAEVDRLQKICRDDQDVIITREYGTHRVYLQQSAPLVANPRTWKEEVTFLKHLVRTGQLDLEKAYTSMPDATKLRTDDFLQAFAPAEVELPASAVAKRKNTRKP